MPGQPGAAACHSETGPARVLLGTAHSSVFLSGLGADLTFYTGPEPLLTPSATLGPAAATVVPIFRQLPREPRLVTTNVSGSRAYWNWPREAGKGEEVPFCDPLR